MFLFNKKQVMTNEEKILGYLKKAIPSSKINGNGVYLSKYKLTIEPHIGKIDNNSLAKVVDLFFNIKHELFCESFIESATGIGKNLEEAFQQCVDHFLVGPLYVIKNCISGKSNENFETTFLGKRKGWQLFQGSIQGIRDEEEKKYIRIWSIIGEKAKARLGNKKIYWIKIYIGKFSNGEIISKCRINGVYNNEISDDISEYIKTWKGNRDIYSLKQYFLIKQHSETYSEYEFSEETVKEFTKRAVKVLGVCNSEEKLREVNDDIYKITGDLNLAYEIKSFIPEMLCELVFSNVKYGDRISIIKDNNRSLEFYKNQFTSYYWIYSELANNYYHSNVLEEEIKTIILLSSSYEVINNALDTGTKIQDLKNLEITLYAFKEYIPA
ncbi:hypothetical protein CLOBL_26400 [Clostridium sp. BL-8]|nr:hypothetical protein CLOBL_26400 [Clostridium sp. BL-8]